MMAPRHLFLDFDETLSDYGEMGRQYAASLARLLSAEFGCSRDVWLSAIVPSLKRSLARYADTFEGRPLAGFRAWLAVERERVVRELFSCVGCSLPRGQDLVRLGERLRDSALSECRAVFPGVPEALLRARAAGYTVHLASSWESGYLRSALAGAGIGHLVEWKFGADLVDCAKEGPEFYRRIFRAAGADPEQCLVVDDLPACLAWAAEAGARVVQARMKDDSPDPITDAVIRVPADLAELLGVDSAGSAGERPN